MAPGGQEGPSQVLPGHVDLDARAGVVGEVAQQAAEEKHLNEIISSDPVAHSNKGLQQREGNYSALRSRACNGDN